MGHKEQQTATTAIAASKGVITEDSSRTIIGIDRNGAQVSRKFPNDATMRQWMTQRETDGIEIIRVF